MERKKLLYPLAFQSVEEQASWGTDSYLVADLSLRDTAVEGGWLNGNPLSEVIETYMERLVGDDTFAYYGRQFPLMLRRIKTTSNYPVMVCPSDEVAGQRYDALGKAKFWYILDAEPGSKIYLGLKKTISASDFYTSCCDGSIVDALTPVTPVKGSYYKIEPNVIHAASAGLTILEVAEASEIDMVLYDRNAPTSEPAEGVVESMDFVRLEKGLPSAAAVAKDESSVPERLEDCSHFAVSKIDLSDAVHVFTDEFDSFLIYYCLRGEASVEVNAVKSAGSKGSSKPVSYILSEGSVITVPAEVPDFFIVPRQEGTVIMEVMARKHSLEDPYIDPDVPSALDDEDNDKKSIFDN